MSYERVEEIAVMLRDSRRSQGLSQERVCDRAGYMFVPSQVSNWEAGICQPTGRNLLLWAEALGFEVVFRCKAQGAAGK